LQRGSNLGTTASSVRALASMPVPDPHARHTARHRCRAWVPFAAGAAASAVLMSTIASDVAACGADDSGGDSSDDSDVDDGSQPTSSLSWPTFRSLGEANSVLESNANLQLHEAEAALVVASSLARLVETAESRSLLGTEESRSVSHGCTFVVDQC